MSLRSLAIAAGLLIGLGVPTVASAAYTTGSVNLRSGPGVNYRVITTAPRGAYVRVQTCVPRWCRVVLRGRIGWMSAGYIASAPPRYRAPRYYYRPAPPPPVYYPRYYYPRAPVYRPYPYPYPYRYRPYRYYGYRSPSFGFYYYGR